MSSNQTKQEENVSVQPSPPSVIRMKTETAEPAETTTVNTEIEEVTSSTEVFNPGSAQRAETPKTTMSPDSGADTYKSNDDKQATAESSFSGLRMRENIPDKGSENEDRAAANWPESERKQDNKQTIHELTADQLPETTEDIMPLCRGLIHRTEAGRKHCVERFAGMGSKTFSSGETTDGFKDTGESGKDSPLNDDGYEHFYYFDGVLRAVQNNFYPYDRRRRRRHRRHDNTGRRRRDTHENLLSYIRRLTLRNEANGL